MKRVAAVISICAFLIAACAVKTKDTPTAATTANGASWTGQMRSMAASLQKLLPYVFSRQEFQDSSNRKSIQKLIKEFAESVEHVPEHVGEVLLGKDPIVRYSISRLEANTRNAKRAFDEGHLEFARGVLRENMGLCFSCHTTTQFGPENNFSTKALPSSFRISSNEKADYYVATRQFDRAVDVLEGSIKSPALVAENPQEQVAAVRKFLALEVRVKNDPIRAASTLESFLANDKLPYFIAADAEVWLKSLREMARNHKNAATLGKGKELIEKGLRKQSQGGYQAGYVDFLRASTVLHEALRTAKKDAQKAEIFQLLGKSYDTLAEMGTWDLPEVYFEACIRQAPGTAIAKKCYRDFERAMIMGFSGSAGIFIPKEERERMAELKRLSGLN